MTLSPPPVKTIAPLKNVALFLELVEKLQNREPELPPFGLFYGQAGLGKSIAATHAANVFRAYYVECKSVWARKAFCEAIMVELGLLAPRTSMKKTISEAVDEIGDFLADHPGRPLFIDEADFLEKKGMIEIVRDISKGCAAAGTSIIFIGELNLFTALNKHERIASRILSFVKAQAPDIDDVKALVEIICPDLKLNSDVIKRLSTNTNGSARRVSVKLYELREVAALAGETNITLDVWNPAEDV